MPAADVTVTAVFSRTYALRGEGFTFTNKSVYPYETLTAALPGTPVTVEAPEREGYVVTALTCAYGDEQMDITWGKAFTMPEADVTVTAEYTLVADIPVVTTIRTEEDLRDLALGVNTGAHTYQGETVALAGDVTLTGASTPIGMANHPFLGTFDGGGHTVSRACRCTTPRSPRRIATWASSAASRAGPSRT